MPVLLLGDCHGSSGDPVGLDKESRRTPEHQEYMRARKESALEHEKATEANDCEEDVIERNQDLS